MNEEEIKDCIQILKDTDISTIEMCENTDMYTYSIAVKNVLNELEKYKLMLFIVVRNSKILPVGLKLNKTQKEITKMAKDTIRGIEAITDFRKAKELYDLD